MLFGEPQCIEVGSLQLGGGTRTEEVLVEPRSGRLWLISDDRQQVSLLDASLAESALTRQAAQLEACVVPTELLFSLTDSARQITTESPSSSSRDKDKDAIVTVLFSPPQDNDVELQVAVIVTRRGGLVVRDVDNPAVSLAAYGLPVEGIYHSLMLPGATGAAGVNVLVCLTNGLESEVAAITLDPAALGSDRSVKATRAPPVRGLFRAAGHVSTVLFDPAEMAVLCVTAAGAVDVWSWREEADATTLYTAMAYDTAALGAPVDGAALLAGGCVWLGTAGGDVVRLPFQRLAGTTTDKDPRLAASQMSAHRGRVATLHVMSLGTRVWSCGADGKICVWDTSSGDLCGSFLFSPDAEDTSVTTTCAPLVTTPLWGVDPRSGTLTSFNVSESLADGIEPHLTTLAQQRRVQAQLRESTAMRQVLECLAASCTAAVTGDTPPPATIAQSGWAAADGLEDSLSDDVKHVLRVVNDTVACRDLVRRYQRARARQHVDASGPSIADGLRVPLQQMMSDAHRLWCLEDEVRGFLRHATAMLAPATPLDSLDDVGAALEELPNLLEAAKTGPAAVSADVEEAAAAPASAAHTTKELHVLQQALQVERELRASVEQALASVTEENRELSSRVELLSKQVQRGDEEGEMLKRSLLASRKAAEAQSTEAAKLYGLEARLGESEERNTTLEREVARLRVVEETAQGHAESIAEMQTALARYKQKEALAQRAIADFLHTQSVISTQVQQMSEYADELDAQRQTDSRSSTGQHFDDLVSRVRDLDETIDDILYQQKTYIQDLKREFLT